LCAAALLLALAGASSASADINICVGADTTGACPAGSTAASDLADAASKALDLSLNTIYVNSGTYSSANGVDFANKPVKILGVGPTTPILTIDPQDNYSPGTSVVSLANSLHSELNNLQFDLPASTGLTGISTQNGGQKITNVTVNGPDADDSTGIVLSDASPLIRNATINVGAGTSKAVSVVTSTSAIVDDVTVTHATTAVSLSSATTFKIRRLKSQAKVGIASTDSDGAISSSLIQPSTIGAENSGGKGVSASSTSGAPKAVRVDNCTLIGGGNGTVGVASSASGVSSSQSVAVNSSILSGYEGSTSTSGAASINLDYTRYTSATSGTTTVAGTSHLSGADFGFANAAGGDYSLTLSSPLVDAGDPAALNSNDSATDASDQPRVVSRGAGNIRDIGAYEVQNTTPVPRIQIVTAVPSTTSNTQFSAAGSTDAEGDPLTYDWKFDGIPGVSGVTTQKMFVLEGPHSVQLTVTDRSGSSATISTQFDVARGFLAIKLRSQDATISKKGTFKITMSCPAAAVSNCSGRLLFQTTKKVNAKDYSERPGWAAAKPDYLQAARYVFSIAPGTTQKLVVRTYSTFQNVLGVHKKFKIQSNLVSGTTSNANLTANRATFTIRAPKTSKKK
jgi:hypothetical protein